MKSGVKILLATSFCIFLATVSNIPSVSLAIMLMMNDSAYKKTNYHYSSGKEAGFSVWSRKGHDDVVDQFSCYKKGDRQDTVLYRNFKPVPWKVWRWYAYLTEPGYKLPYRDLPHDAYLVSRGMVLPNEMTGL